MLFFSWSALVLALSLPLALVPRAAMMWCARRLASGTVDLLKVVVGLRHELRGDSSLLRQPVIIACKHQSAWDTFIFYLIARDPAYVMKKELMLIPVYGWLARKQRMIPIDRKAGAAALRGLLRAAERALADRRQIVIFPQGTRVAPGRRAPYQPGVAALYARLGCPVVPVALNSGCFWPRRSFLKYPGKIVVEVLPPIAPGLAKSAFMAELERRIETASARLEAEARASSPVVDRVVDNPRQR
ncbi:MAG TPA: 1-acyl-sn-glycerol-3-phosphate acyltransferase [Alphaproteobacteria bacterium]|nr:1-acyl-sn-glycerol-3-phosphate acyltransferase [Alphaproteobacteria bacterium]